MRHATCDMRERHHDFSTCDRRMSHGRKSLAHVACRMSHVQNHHSPAGRARPPDAPSTGTTGVSPVAAVPGSQSFAHPPRSYCIPDNGK